MKAELKNLMIQLETQENVLHRGWVKKKKLYQSSKIKWREEIIQRI